MTFPTTPPPDGVNVPQTKGVPPLAGKRITPLPKPENPSQTRARTRSRESRGWGIFDKKGRRVLGAAQVEMARYNKSYDVSTAPQEDGAFVQYNKVASPATATLRLLCDGTETDGKNNTPSDTIDGVKKAFMDRLEILAADLDFYTVRTPERDYPRLNIKGYDFERSAQSGATLITAVIYLTEVRNTLTLGFTKTKTDAGMKVVQSGVKQTIAKN